MRRKTAADRAAQAANARPSSTRAAGAGGSSSTMLKLYTDESPGLKVDPVIVLVLSLGFIFSVVAMHSEFSWYWRNMEVTMLIFFAKIVIAKLSRKFAA
jgi:preprotein translocase subunit Sec61beta